MYMACLKCSGINFHQVRIYTQSQKIEKSPLNMQEQGQFIFLCVQLFMLESVLITGTGYKL
jgi:hypothetical protein